MSAYISLKNISVSGVNTHARASTLRQWFIKGESLKSSRIPILTDVTFEAKPGDRVGIFGLNGSGKSSMLKVISGNYPIHAGTREVQGAIVPLIEMGAGFTDEITGRQNIRLSYAYRGKLKYYSNAIEEKIIAFSELEDHIDLPLKSYSSGMRARLAFASAIFQEPDILLLDEVFAAGDASFIEKSTLALKRQIDKASITIMVSHSAQEMHNLCNRFVLVHGGKILMEGSGKETEAAYRALFEQPEPTAHPAYVPLEVAYA